MRREDGEEENGGEKKNLMKNWWRMANDRENRAANTKLLSICKWMEHLASGLREAFPSFTPIRAEEQQLEKEATIGPNGMRKNKIGWTKEKHHFWFIYFIFVFLVARGRASLEEANIIGELNNCSPPGSKKLLGDYKTNPISPISVHSPRSALG